MSGKSVGARVLRSEDPRLLAGTRRVRRRHPPAGHAARGLCPRAPCPCAPPPGRRERGPRNAGRPCRLDRRRHDARHARPSHAGARPHPLREIPAHPVRARRGRGLLCRRSHRDRDRGNALHRRRRRRRSRNRLRNSPRRRRLPRRGESGRAARPPLDHAEQRSRRFKVGYGDVANAFRTAAHVFKEELWHHRGCGHSLETRAVLADPGPATDASPSGRRRRRRISPSARSPRCWSAIPKPSA